MQAMRVFAGGTSAVAVLCCVATLALAWPAQAQQSKALPDFSLRWTAQLQTCGAPDAACIAEAHRLLAEDFPEKAPANRIRQVDLLMLQDPDDTAYSEADQRLKAEVAALSDPVEKADLLAAAGSHLANARPQAAAVVLAEATSLLTLQEPSERRDKAMTTVAEWTATLPAGLPQAEQIASRISDPSMRIAAFADIARASIEQTPDSDRYFQLAINELTASPELPGFVARLSFHMAMKAGKRESDLDKVIAFIELKQAADDGWAEDEDDLDRFLDDLKAAKRALVVQRGAFPGPDQPAQPEWLKGPYSEIIRLHIEDGRFDMAEQYFLALSLKSSQENFNYYSMIARSRLDRGEYEQLTPALGAIFQHVPVDETSLLDHTWRKFAELLADVVRAKQQMGIDDEAAAMLQTVPCSFLDQLMARSVEALLQAPEAEMAGIEMNIGETVGSLVYSGCGEEWVGWLSDPRLAGSASRNLVAALRVLRR